MKARVIVGEQVRSAMRPDRRARVHGSQLSHHVVLAPFRLALNKNASNHRINWALTFD